MNKTNTAAAHLTATRCDWAPRLRVVTPSGGSLVDREVLSGLQVAALLATATRFYSTIGSDHTDAREIVFGAVKINRRCREIECDTCHGGQ